MHDCALIGFPHFIWLIYINLNDSNSDNLREKIGKGRKDPLFALEIGDEDIVKSLRLCWEPVVDKLRFNVSTNI